MARFNIQHVENDLLRRSLFVILLIPVLLTVYVVQGIRDIIEWHRDSFRNIGNDCHDIWKTSVYRENKYVFRDFSKDPF